VTAYVEWVLGTTRSATAPYIVTEIDLESGAMFARNPWNADFGTRVAFADLLGKQTAWTGDRREFLGRNGTLDAPAALAEDAELSNRVGAGFDPCGALQTSLELRSNAATEVVFVLGQAATQADARALIARYRASDLDRVLEAVTQRWDDVLGAVQVKTPDRAMDILLNHWLLYQTLSCRIWARSGFYQASGAYGFRDQLQDGMALVIARPDLTREHLLRAAARQFSAGDVQHWWLPVSGKGVHAPPTSRMLPPSRSTPRRWRSRVLDERSVPRGVRASPERARRLRADVAETGRSSSTARARSIAACRSARTVCRSSAAGTGTTA
jgi:cyclic beta-1,2-glucan synthetase